MDEIEIDMDLEVVDNNISDEVSLLTDGVRPATTEELVEMLKLAGTEMTVKYLTGEVTFENFSKVLEKSKKSVESKAPLAERQVSSTYATGNIPAFDQLLEEASQEDVVDYEEDEDYEEVEEAKQEQFYDKDEDWLPESKSKKGKSKEEKHAGDRKKKKRKQRKKTFDVPKELAGVKGQAMLLRAQGKTDEAVSLLYEIINRMPKAAMPFETLGSIHEDKGDMAQALKFYMVAANLKGTHATEWMDLAEMCIAQKEEKMALICFSKALRNATNKDGKLLILQRKCEFLEPSVIKVLQCKEQMLQFMDRSEPRAILTFARHIANEFLEKEDESGAISVYQYIHREFPNDIDSEDVHHLAELLMSQKSYEKCIEIIIRHCGVETVFSGTTPSLEELAMTIEKFSRKEVTLDRLTVPHLMPIDLRSKLVQCILLTRSLSSLDILKELINSVIEPDVEHYGDAHYDIAENMVECGFLEEARPILYSLTNSQNFNKAAVWLTYGQCLNALGDIKEAAKAYTHVVELAPGHYNARVTLSSLLQQMGQNDIALDILSKGPTEEGEATADQLLLMHKCQLLHSQGKLNEFISTTKKLLSYHIPGQLNPDFIKIMLALRTTKSRHSLLCMMAGKKVQTEKTAEAETAENKTAKEMSEGEAKKFRASLWDIFCKMCKAMYEKGMTEELHETVTLGLICKQFSRDHGMVKDAEFLCLKVGPLNLNLYHLARSFIIEEKEKTQAYNLYCYIMTKLKEVTDLRFAVRALMKNPNCLALILLNGNARMISGTYKQALTEYLSVLRKTPDNDMALLCSALCLAHIASQAYSTRKNALIAQVICFMTAYKEMRGECQETYYNIGRVLQQLNIPYAAVYYFKKALEFPPCVADEEGTFNLQHEIAYNLALIYQRSNNLSLAQYYIDNYCIV
ncbi:general transcription factor 3C polypeptide 3 [Biomphalaria pfeifferi]|uniref:General transcription factor 3C polypeptide 3 n=1 Tax=Biomphalaria pfeifferi TaxID=112525 RepID=A0AAD8C980_BIOPF|nr:general transcription factor 3C polypeptide 3 [Biomphalaria pfeifferi]